MINISVIIIANNLERWIRHSVMSVVDQLDKSDDTELIVIDNGSIDKTTTILEEIQYSHPEILIHILKNKENLGPGEARNRGMELARGRYLAFLDGDDWLDIAAIQSFRRIISAYPDIDIFLYNHARVYSDERIIENRLGSTLPQGEVTSVEQRRALIPNLSVAWNKLYSKDFIERYALRFQRGIYEDIDWNYRAILSAERLHSTRDILVYYRQWQGSTLKTEAKNHFDIFGQWRSVLSFLDSHPELCLEYGPEIEAYAVRQTENILFLKDRVPAPVRRAFFAEMASLWEQFDQRLRGHARRRLRLMDRQIREERYLVYRLLKGTSSRVNRARARFAL